MEDRLLDISNNIDDENSNTFNTIQVLNSLDNENLTTRLNHSGSLMNLGSNNNPFSNINNRTNDPIRVTRNPFTLNFRDRQPARTIINEVPEIPAFRNAFNRSRVIWDNSTEDFVLNETRQWRRGRPSTASNEVIGLRNISDADNFYYMNEGSIFDNNFNFNNEFKFLSEKNGKSLKRTLLKLQEKNLLREEVTNEGGFKYLISSFFNLIDKMPIKVIDFIKCLPSTNKIMKLTSHKLFNDSKVYNEILFMKICLDLNEIYFKEFEPNAKIVNKIF